MQNMMIDEFDNISCGEWLRIWYETYKVPVLKPYSLRNIEQMIRLHTPQWFKEIPLRSVSVFDVDKALSTVTTTRTRAYTRQVWFSAFLKALKLGLIERNVISLSEPIKHRKKPSRALTIAEQESFLNAINGKRVKWLMLFYIYTGVRRSEATSLLWSDIFEREQLVLIRGTKTSDSFRYILLTDELRDIFASQRAQCQRDIGTRFESKHPEKVFDYSPGYLSQAFKKYSPHHHLHELRHTFITRCAECGINVNVCQQLVGHSTPQMTMGVYTHVFDDFKRREAAKFTITPKY